MELGGLGVEQGESRNPQVNRRRLGGRRRRRDQRWDRSGGRQRNRATGDAADSGHRATGDAADTGGGVNGDAVESGGGAPGDGCGPTGTGMSMTQQRPNQDRKSLASTPESLLGTTRSSQGQAGSQERARG